MAQFSGAVKLADLNDFIAPSQACVVNVDGSKKAKLQLDSSDFDIRPEVCVDGTPELERLTVHDRTKCASTVNSPSCRVRFLQVGAVQPQQRSAVGFQQTAPSGPNGAIKVTLQVRSICLDKCCLAEHPAHRGSSPDT